MTVHPSKTSLLVRAVVYGFFVAMLAIGAAGVEFWPMSAFRLFSERRTAVQVRWELAAVSSDGTELAVDFASMGRGFRQSGHHLPALAHATEPVRTRTCSAWFGRLPEATSLRVYRSVVKKFSPGEPPGRVERTLRATCERPRE